MTRWIVLPLCLLFAAVAALGLLGVARQAVRDFGLDMDNTED